MNVAGKFARIISRGYASHKSPEQLEAGVKLWKHLTFFLAIPAVALASANAYMKHMHEEERPEYVPYEYLGIRNKPYPWGDGNHSLLHNPKKNAVPGVGYEA